MNEPVTKAELKAELSNYATKEDLKVALSNYPTKEDLNVALSNYPTKDDLKVTLNNFHKELLEDIRDVIFEAVEVQGIKIDKAIARLDRHVAKNALEHNKFDDRIHLLEVKTT